MGLLDRIDAARRGTVAHREETRNSIDRYISEYLLPTTFGYNGNQYVAGAGAGTVTTLAGTRSSEIVATLPGYSQALRQCPPAFGAEMVRALVLSQARFTFRTLPSAASPRKTFGTRELSILERPWTNATTGELIARMEWHAGLAGNAYVLRQGDRLRVLRPDWVAILYGSHQEPDDAAGALDGEIIGYVYQNGGLYSGGNRPQTLLPADVAHWSPIPDPEHAGVGMSWITPAVRDIRADIASTQHQINYWQNAATPNLVIKGIPALTKEQFGEIVEMIEQGHRGVANAFKTLYLTAGADATVVGANLADLDLRNSRGGGETRISLLSRVPASLLGIAEGLAGSSLNAGNFGMARRIFADSWVYPSLQDLAAAVAPLVRVPRDAELWFETADMPLLREDAKDAADIEQVKATTITMYVREGFTAESAVAAVRAQDITLLKHTGMTSVQLQTPGATSPAPAEPTDQQRSVPGPPPFGDDDDEMVDALLAAMAELTGVWATVDSHRDAAFEAKHKRGPGGKFIKMVDRLIGALKAHQEGGGQDDPFEGFSREQLRRVAKERGIDLPRGADRDHITKALLDDLGAVQGRPKTPAKKVPDKPRQPPARGQAALDSATIAVNSDMELDGLDANDPRAKQAQTAISDYQLSDGYERINGALRSGKTARGVEHLDWLMDQSPLVRDVEVHRGIYDPAAVFGGAWNDTSVVGLEWDELGFVSTSADEEVVHSFAAGDSVAFPVKGVEGVVMTITLPAGTGAVQLSDLHPDGSERVYGHEAELLAQRGLRFRVTSDTGRMSDEDIEAGGIRHLTVEVVPDGEREEATPSGTQAAGHGLPGAGGGAPEDVGATGGKPVKKGIAPKAAPPSPQARLAELHAMSNMDARDALDDMTRTEVYALLHHLGVKGQSKARKRELVDLVLSTMA